MSDTQTFCVLFFFIHATLSKISKDKKKEKKDNIKRTRRNKKNPTFTHLFLLSTKKRNISQFYSRTRRNEEY